MLNFLSKHKNGDDRQKWGKCKVNAQFVKPWKAFYGYACFMGINSI